jgi:hypothetical protein
MEATDMNFRKSSYSQNQGNCVETASDAGQVAIRDTAHRDGGTLVVSAAAWQAFTAGIR